MNEINRFLVSTTKPEEITPDSSINQQINTNQSKKKREKNRLRQQTARLIEGSKGNEKRSFSQIEKIEDRIFKDWSEAICSQQQWM